MDEKKDSGGNEILYLDEVPDEVSKPLTFTNLEAPSVSPRAGFVSDEGHEDNSRFHSEKSDPDSLLIETKIDDEKVDRSAPLTGFDNRNGPQTGWINSLFSEPPTQVVTPDVNIYQHKKTLAQGMMDLALLSANANQMRYVLQTDGKHPYFYPSLIMIAMSLFLQIAVGIGLIWNSVYDVKEHEQMCKANKANNWTVIGIFLVTILNVFISSFGVVDQSVVAT